MTFQAIRAHIESRVFTAFQNLNPPVEVVWDNAQETPPALPYIVCTISYTDTTAPVVCQETSMLLQVNGNLQLAAYAPRGRGMGALEVYGAEAMSIMNNLYDPAADVRVKCGVINGPVALLGGDQPYAMVNVSCPFTARVIRQPGDCPDDGSTGTTRLRTNQVALTNPQP